VGGQLGRKTMKLSKEEIDSIIVNDIMIGNHFRAGYLELYPELS
jgi:hypothetical protein